MRVISQSLDPLTRMYTMTKRQGKSGTIDRCWYRSILVSAAPPTSITAMRRQAPSSMPISAWPSWSLVYSVTMIAAGGIWARLVDRYLDFTFVSRSWFNLEATWVFSLILVGALSVAVNLANL
jgi:hypothetical protein